MIEHIATRAGIASSSMVLHTAFDVVLHILADSHACKGSVVVDACMSVGNVDDAACLDGIGSGEDVSVDDFGIGSGLWDEIEVQELVTADAIVVDVEIDGEAAVGELLESNFDEFFGVDGLNVCHSLFLSKLRIKYSIRVTELLTKWLCGGKVGDFFVSSVKKPYLCRKIKTGMKYVSWVWRNMVGIRLNTALRIVIGISQVLLGLLMVWLSKRFIDVTIWTGSKEDVVEMILLLVATVVGGILLRQLYYYMTISANTRQTNAIRLRIFSNLFRRQMYEENWHSGDITSRLEKDLDAIAEVTTTSFPQFVVMTCQMLGAFFLMKSMDARLAWALLLLTPLFLVFGKVLAHKLRNMTMDIRKQESLIQMLVQEGMEHNEVLRSLESEGWVTGRLNQMQHSLKGKVLKRTRFTAIARILLAMSFSLGYLLAFVWGGLQLRDGVITFGVMTSFLQLVSQLQHPILNLLNMVPQFIHASASITRLQELEEAGKEAQIEKNTEVLEGQVGVRVEDLDFSYAMGDRQIFSRFSHDFRPGSKTALMGQTGAGKTTLFRLMLGLATPKEGKIVLYNGQKSVEVSANTRTNFVFVPQGNTLMSGSVRYNLLLANPDATDDELKQVLHTAMADFVLEHPDGLEMELGERGVGLSEGQAQRIAIARGLLRPGGVLLLDEISSSLDGKTERQLFENIFKNYPDKTMIFITHRTEVCSLCDEVMNLT